MHLRKNTRIEKNSVETRNLDLVPSEKEKKKNIRKLISTNIPNPLISLKRIIPKREK